MNIKNNPIKLRIATPAEAEFGRSMITPHEERHNCGGYSFYMEQPQYVLVSTINLNLYGGFENNNGEIESSGWLGR
uniref:Uncharacterized protein n=1 Tax=viral metagenome TaxID=1070528 RepID=A0A6H1Z760_9ZZZZ